MVEDSSSNDGGSQDLGLAGVNLKCGASVVNRAGPDSLGGSEVVRDLVSHRPSPDYLSFQGTEGRQLGSGELDLLGAQNPFDILATARGGQASLNLNQQ